MSLRILAASLLLLASAPAQAAPAMCPTEHERLVLTTFRDQIAAAPTPEASKRMALRQTRLAHLAVAKAARTFPGSPGIQQANARLDAFDAGIASATTSEEVADQFDTVVEVGSGAGGCDYNTTEIVIIVIGFVFGILPGILFLFLFC